MDVYPFTLIFYFLNKYNLDNFTNIQVVAQYLGYTNTFELMPDVPIHWPNGGPHPNKPICGFVGELCRTYCKYLGHD